MSNVTIHSESGASKRWIEHVGSPGVDSSETLGPKTEGNSMGMNNCSTSVVDGLATHLQISLAHASLYTLSCVESSRSDWAFIYENVAE
jgi:hypothetical protein